MTVWTPRWDGPRLAEVPSPDRLESVFDQVTLTWRSTLQVGDLWLAVERLGWPVRQRRLAEGGTSIQSLLVPLLRGGFSIVVNSEHNPSPSRIAWLVAHEFAHSLFYSGHAPPRRIIPLSEQEEAFCDAFADLARLRAAAPQLV